MQALICVAGAMAMLAFAYLLSSDRRMVKPRTVIVAVALQATVAALVLYVPAGSDVLDAIVKGVQYIINYANDGIDFVLE